VENCRSWRFLKGVGQFQVEGDVICEPLLLSKNYSDCPFMWYQNIGSTFLFVLLQGTCVIDRQNYDYQDHASIAALCGKNPVNFEVLLKLHKYVHYQSTNLWCHQPTFSVCGHPNLPLGSIIPRIACHSLCIYVAIYHLHFTKVALWDIASRHVIAGVERLVWNYIPFVSNGEIWCW